MGPDAQPVLLSTEYTSCCARVKNGGKCYFQVCQSLDPVICNLSQDKQNVNHILEAFAYAQGSEWLRIALNLFSWEQTTTGMPQVQLSCTLGVLSRDAVIAVMSFR